MDKIQDTKNRPPIVTIMGHVDHGKTTLLDAIRKTNVVKSEHGGITQHIGAYQVDFKGHPITFVDTPGHEAFEKMRSRGAEVADIVILVVAATEGVKPQTVEAIKHIKAAGKPVIVAATKVDLPNINLDKVKKELQTNGITVEKYGGDVPIVEVAATKGQGLEELLEVINLLWQITPQPSLPGDPLEAVVIESSMDKSRGPISTLIILKGTLRTGQKITIGSESITVRAIVDDSGKNVKEATPSKPVEVLGFKKPLEVGSIVNEENLAKAHKAQVPASFEDIISKAEEIKGKFKVIIKADVAGSLEAVLNKLPANVLIASSSVGEVTSNDISFAKIAQAPILAFNSKVTNSIKTLAEREGVVIRTYNVIYKLLEDMEAVVDSFEHAKHEAKILGRGKVLSVFVVDGVNIAGVSVTEGKIKVGDEVLVKDPQNNTFIETKVISLKKYKKDIQSASAGQECGVGLEPTIDFKEGYIIESLG